MTLVAADLAGGVEQQVVRVAHPETGEQEDELRWGTFAFRIRNDGEQLLRGIETRLVPSDAITELYDDVDPFAAESGGRSNYGKRPFDLAPGKELEIRRSIITFAFPTEYASNVENPLTLEETKRLREVADQAELEVTWNSGCWSRGARRPSQSPGTRWTSRAVVPHRAATWSR